MLQNARNTLPVFVAVAQTLAKAICWGSLHACQEVQNVTKAFYQEGVLIEVYNEKTLAGDLVVVALAAFPLAREVKTCPRPFTRKGFD